MKGLLLMLSFLTATLMTFGGKAVAEDGGYCNAINPSAPVCIR